MGEHEGLARTYLIADSPGPASSEVVADLLERAAGVLRRNGELTVHHVVFETTDRVADAKTMLTIYYERVERRRTERY